MGNLPNYSELEVVDLINSTDDEEKFVAKMELTAYIVARYLGEHSAITHTGAIFNASSGDTPSSGDWVAFDEACGNLSCTARPMETMAEDSVGMVNSEWPNPSTGDVYLDWPGEAGARAVIFDLRGRHLAEMELQPRQNRLAMAGRSRGLYLIRMGSRRVRV